MKRNKKLYIFTLIELLVAMSVFSILLVILLQFFSGAQRIWTSTDKKNNLFADARMTTELLSNLLTNAFVVPAIDASADQIPFVIQENSPNSGDISMYFATNTQMDLPKDISDIRFIKFGFDATHNQLYMNILSDEADSGNADGFTKFFPPYNGDYSGIDSTATARTALMNVLSPTNHEVVLLENVMDFEVVPYALSSSSPIGFNRIGLPTYDVPYFIEIRIKLMDEESKRFLDNELSTATATVRANYQSQHEYLFTRAIFIGDKN